MEKNIRKWIMDYGVIAHRRFYRKEKIRFIQVIEHEFHHMGYKTSILSPKGEKGNAFNLLIGDVLHAKNIITASYDTPVKSFGLFTYEPFNLRHRNRWYMGIVAVPLIVISLLCFFFSTYYLKIEWLKGIFHMNDLWALIIYGIGIFLIVRFSKGIPNKYNLNRNSAAIVSLLQLASELDEKQRSTTAFVLTDFGCINHLGDQMLKAYLKKYKNQKFVLLDCIGSKENTAVCYSRIFEQKIKKLDNSIIKFEVNDTNHNIAQLYPNTLVISNGNMKENTFCCSNVNTKKDLYIEPEQILKTCALIKSIIY